MIKVLQISGDGTALVSTVGLFRVVIQPSTRVVRELCEQSSAEVFVASFNSSNRSSRAEAIDYAEVFQRASSA